METSLRKRYLFKVMTNLVGLAVGIGTQSIVPRALGPASYGDFSFLTNFFYQIVGFLNLNTSTAYYTKLSQRQHDTGLVRFYLYFMMLLGLTLCVFVAFSFAGQFDQLIWPGQAGLFVFFGVLWAFMTFCAMITNDMTDAYGKTVKAEMIKMTLKVIGLLFVIILFWQNLLSLRNFFLYQFVILFLTIWGMIHVIQRNGINWSGSWIIPKEEFKSYTREFTVFSAPLVAFSCASVLEGLLDRWFLQQYSGSVQQGFYGFAYQIGTLCFLFASAMVPLVFREFAISGGKGDTQALSRLFSRFVPMLYSIAAYFGCFLAVESKNLTLLFGGNAYAGAVLPISIMCFYPIHQTYGQINASFFFATNRTSAYRNIGIALMFVGLPLTLILLGPKEHGALQAGATGLAVKMVFIQFLSVNVQLWYNVQLMGLSFMEFFGHQIVVLVTFTSAAMLCSYAVQTLLGYMHFGLQFLTGGFIYTLIIAILCIAFPRLFAVRKEELFGLMKALKKVSR